MAVWNFNKDSWNDVYPFMRMLGECRIYGGSSDLQREGSPHTEIINILRDEADRMLIFERFIADNIARIGSSEGRDIVRVVTVPEVGAYAQSVYDALRSTREDCMIGGWDAPDRSTVVDGLPPKSHTASSVTLFNCPQSSGLTFEIRGCSEEGLHQLNALGTFLDIVAAIKENYSLKYAGCRNAYLAQNIALIDSRMEEVLSAALLIQAGYYGDVWPNNVKGICEILAEINPIRVMNPQLFYTVKFKDFLLASFAGMTASMPWNGRKRLTGGCIDVDREDEIPYYRAASDDIFGNYLFENTFLDLPEEGCVYARKGKCYIDLNLQIRCTV